MCLGLDYIADYAFERDFPFGTHKYWETQAGKKLRPCEMTTKHIINCLRIVKDVDDEWYHIFREELEKRGVKIFD